MPYAIIHKDRLIGLRTKRDKAKADAAEAATAGVNHTGVQFLYEGGDTERWEVLYQPARSRRWVHTGYFVESGELAD